MAARRMPGVLMTADTVGGVWTYAVELARALEACRVRVGIATMGGPLSRHQRAQLAGSRRITVFESGYRLEWMQDCTADVEAAGEWLLELERTFRPDIVHLNQYAFGALPFSAPTLVVAHSCVLSWWQAVRGEPAPREWNPYRLWVARGLAGAGLVVAPTRAMLESLAGNHGLRKRGLVIPNGASTSQFSPARKQHFVLAAGRFWDAAKNLAALEQVAPALPWPVRVAGAYKHPDGGAVAPAGVECLGELSRDLLARQFAGAAIYALPARYEPFGLSVLEAGLSGCALVLGDIPSLRETWGEAALYVQPEDTRALQAALHRLIDNPAQRRRHAQAALARARQFTPERMCDGYLQAYAQLSPRFAPSATEEEPVCA